MTVVPKLTYRDDYSTPHDRIEVYKLLREVFDFDVSPLRDMDLWDPSYRAFSYLDEAGTCIANAATCNFPLVINGCSTKAMGIQSVATRPAWRCRGLGHDLLRRALNWCDTNTELVFLMTSIPAFYEPMGFRIVPQFAYVGDAPTTPPRSPNCRRLNLDAAVDRQVLTRYLRHKSPVSMYFAVDGLRGPFALNLLDQADLSAWEIASHNAIVVTAERQDDMLSIVDIVAPEMPKLVEVLAALGGEPRRVEVHFPPDQLGWNGTAVPIETSTNLMVRGDTGPLKPFMLPETAAF